MKQFLTKNQCKDLEKIGFRPSGINIAAKLSTLSRKYVLNPYAAKADLYEWYPTFTISEMFEILHEMQDENNFTYLLSYESNKYRLSINDKVCEACELIDVLYEGFIVLFNVLYSE